jgi:hydrogenase maturation protease
MNVLVAGIGNIFFGDDGFGVEVAEQLVGRDLPEGVRLGEYGIRGVHLAYELLDGYDALVLIDAVPMRQTPGTVSVLEVDPDDVGGDGATVLDGHAMSPTAVLRLLASLGGRVEQVLVVGCEPAVLDEGIGLSPVVRAAVPAAVDAVLDVVSDVVADPHVPKKGEPSWR